MTVSRNQTGEKRLPAQQIGTRKHCESRVADIFSRFFKYRMSNVVVIESDTGNKIEHVARSKLP